MISFFKFYLSLYRKKPDKQRPLPTPARKSGKCAFPRLLWRLSSPFIMHIAYFCWIVLCLLYIFIFVVDKMSFLSNFTEILWYVPWFYGKILKSLLVICLFLKYQAAHVLTAGKINVKQGYPADSCRDSFPAVIWVRPEMPAAFYFPQLCPHERKEFTC